MKDGPVRPRVLACLFGAAAVAACGNGKQATERFTLIDDMEGTTNAIAWAPPGGAEPGVWWTATDCAQEDRIAPLPFSIDPNAWPYDPLPEPYETLPGVSSQHSARLRTTAPLSMIWGAAIGVNFVAGGLVERDGGLPGLMDPGATCRRLTSLDFVGTTVDLSAYSAVTFWAVAEPDGLSTVHVKLRDRQSDPRGGFCNAADPSRDDGCYNDFEATVVLTDTFVQYTVDLSSLRQSPTWGVRPDPSVLDLEHVYALTFEVDLPICTASANAMCAGGEAPSFTFDVRIDDLYFVNR